MAFDFAAAKNQARRVAHNTLGVPALYQDDIVNPPVEVKVRWHGRIIRNGDIDDYGWADVIEGVNDIVFDVEEARAVGVKPNGLVTLTSSGNVQLRLVARMPKDGGVKETWSVAQVDE